MIKVKLPIATRSPQVATDLLIQSISLLDTHGHALVWRLIVQRLMDALGLIPDAIELPADLTLGHRCVAGPVDLLRLVVTEEALDVRLVIRTLVIRTLDWARVSKRRLEKASKPSQALCCNNGRLCEATVTEVGSLPGAC